MGGSNSRAENNAHDERMATISNTRQRDQHDHELAMQRQTLQRERQQLHAKTKEYALKTDLEIAHDSNSTSRHNTVVQASAERFGSSMHVVSSLGRPMIEGGFQLVGDMYKVRNQKAITQLEENGQTDRKFIDKNIVEIQQNGQTQRTKIQVDGAIEFRKIEERMQENNNAFKLKALNIEVDYKTAIDNGAKLRQITSQQSSSSSSSQSLPMQNVFGTSNSTNNFQSTRGQQGTWAPNNVDYHRNGPSFSANNFTDPNIPTFSSYSGLASSSSSSSGIMGENILTPAPFQTSVGSVLPTNSANIEQYPHLMFNTAQNVLREPNIQVQQVPHYMLEHHLPTQQSSVQNFAYYAGPSQGYFNPN